MITINGQTKISSIIKANKASIEAIASVARPLEKLKNPILRKLLAARITLSEAAEMGGCSVRDVARALQSHGADIRYYLYRRLWPMPGNG
jgi:hypothetical protein